MPQIFAGGNFRGFTFFQQNREIQFPQNIPKTVKRKN